MLTLKPAPVGNSFAAPKRSILTFTLATIGFGVAGFLAHPGIGVWPLGLVMFIPLLGILDQERYARAIYAIFIGGAIAWALSLLWVPTALMRFSSAELAFSWGVYAGVVLAQAMPYGLAMAGAVLLMRLGWSAGFALGIGLAVSETVVPAVLPYSHSSVLVETSAGRSLLSILGRELGTVLVVLANWGILLTTRSGLRMRLIPAVLIGAFFFEGATRFLVSSAEPSGRRFTVGFLQSSLPVEASRTDPDGVFQWHAQMSQAETPTNAPDFLVWGETTLSRATTAKEQRRKVEQLGLTVPVLFGAALVEDGCVSDCPMTNSVLVSRECGDRCRYDKQELVPIAEGRKATKLLKGYAQPGDFATSTRTHALEIAGVRVGTPICYEAIFPNVVASLVDDGARILVNVASTGWLESKMGSRALEGLSRVSAVEHGVPLVRVVDGGVSSVWNHDGRLQFRTADGAGYYVGTVHYGEELSFYSRYRWYLLVAAAAISLAARLLGWGRNTRNLPVREC